MRTNCNEFVVSVVNYCEIVDGVVEIVSGGPKLICSAIFESANCRCGGMQPQNKRSDWNFQSDRLLARWVASQNGAGLIYF